MAVDCSWTRLVLVFVVQTTLESYHPGQGRQPSNCRRPPSDWTAGSTGDIWYSSTVQYVCISKPPSKIYPLFSGSYSRGRAALRKFGSRFHFFSSCNYSSMVDSKPHQTSSLDGGRWTTIICQGYRSIIPVHIFTLPCSWCQKQPPPRILQGNLGGGFRITLESPTGTTYVWSVNRFTL
ncbi:hypothetical protein HOY80DRAFT_115256 [Tuber brumale]|nr:hypothetical protein HOY80DRAFT_115256 [Tuber brumale]